MSRFIPCRCGGNECQRNQRGFSLRFTCAACKRRAPWCFGAADDMPEVCDDCWSAAHQ